MTATLTPPPLRRLEPDRLRQLERHLLSEIARPPSRSPRVTRRTILAAAAVAAVAVVAGVVGLRGGSETASAADVRAKLAQGLRLEETISGRFSVESRDPGPRPGGLPGCQNCRPQVPVPSAFVIAPDGSYSSRTLPLSAAKRRDLAYDAARGVETSFTSDLVDGRGRSIYIRAVNLDPALFPYLPEAHLGAWAQGALAAGDPRVANVTFAGRPAWELTATFTPGESYYDAYGARLDVTVDRETGLVLQIVQYAYDAQRWTSIARVEDLRIGEPVSPGDFTVPKPPGAAELELDYGFRRVPVEEAAATIGYRPLLPADTLGRSLTDFAVAKTSEFPFPGIPPRRDAASARYGRGAAMLTVSTYRGSADDVTSLLPGGTFQTVHPSSGPLAGELAYATMSSLSAAVVVGYADGLVVRITAPAVNEALAVASSLRPAG